METPPVQCIYELDILFILLKKIALAKIPVKTFLDFYLYFSFSVMHMIFKTQKMALVLISVLIKMWFKILIKCINISYF